MTRTITRLWILASAALVRTIIMKQRLLCLSVLLLLIPGLASLMADEPARLTIPKATTTPTLDGRLADGEWGDAAVWTGLVSQLDGTADRRPVTFWITADATHIYVAQRSAVSPREWSPQTPPIWFDKGDSSFVIGLAPGRINRGDEPSHYLLRVNLHGQTISHEITWKITDPALTPMPVV